MTTASHEAGCVCGAVRLRADGPPVRAGVCHCTFCQRRTGSAFGIGVYFRDQDVALLQGELKTYEHRSDASGRKLWLQFCPRCGTTVSWTLELLPGARAVAGGCFDDPMWYRIERHAWLRSAHPWISPPEGVETYEQTSLSQPKPLG